MGDGPDRGLQRRRLRIAITLLVLDIRVPPSEFDDLWSAIFHEWPAYLGYATSFSTIGGIWLAHRGLRRLRYANSAVLRISLLLLMAVSFLPYPTRLVAEAIRDESAERAAAIFYGACLLAVAAVQRSLGSSRAGPRLLRPEVTDDEVNAILLATSPSIGFFAGAIALAIVAPQIAAFGYLLIAVVGVLRSGDEPAELA